MVENLRIGQFRMITLKVVWSIVHFNDISFAEYFK